MAGRRSLTAGEGGWGASSQRRLGSGVVLSGGVPGPYRVGVCTVAARD
ncbi:hypothetical protein [Streptomyces coffeae]|uniref:Uncharacterized protein n=1 Tax=Streptomyces coffeae TaxID=621382 RepID=A0ABS1NPA8_9ACTN|nr:hypothetical protein [Streptomyces coffeae]MBL1101913.1 hypothetical protein [Streptomyces coffeae]